MKKPIEFNFDLWGQNGITVELSDGGIVLTLFKNDVINGRYYGITQDGAIFSTMRLTMYQEVKPREIWVNECESGLGSYGLSKEAAAKGATPHTIRQVKFIEVLEEGK